jgi:hypothetical protein
MVMPGTTATTGTRAQKRAARDRRLRELDNLRIARGLYPNERAEEDLLLTSLYKQVWAEGLANPPRRKACSIKGGHAHGA